MIFEINNKFIVQCGSNQKEKSLKNNIQVSILKNISDLYNTEYKIGHTFQGSIKQLTSDKEFRNYEIAILEINIKDQFVSRREIKKFNDMIKPHN